MWVLICFANKNTAGCKSFKIFLKLVNFDFNPAVFTPKNLTVLLKTFKLFRFPLLAFGLKDIDIFPLICPFLCLFLMCPLNSFFHPEKPNWDYFLSDFHV